MEGRDMGWSNWNEKGRGRGRGTRSEAALERCPRMGTTYPRSRFLCKHGRQGLDVWGG